MNETTLISPPPVIGMLGWEAGENSLSQLERIPGNIVHPDTFRFPIKLVRVEGAHYRTIVEQPSQEVLERMIAAARILEDNGSKAILTSCGFNAIFQQELAEAVNIPVFTSSLIQVPMVHRMLRKDQQVGIITADKSHLSPKHLTQAGITEETSICIQGVENTSEFFKACHKPQADIDSEQFIRDIVTVAQTMSRQNKIGAFVLECTDLPPAAAAIRKTTGLPVFDMITLTNMVYEAITNPGWSCY